MQLTIAILFAFLSLTLQAQDCPKYIKAMDAGNYYLKKTNYDSALKQFQVAQVAARECGIVTKAPADKLKEVFKGLQGQRDEAISQKEANQNLLARNYWNNCETSIRDHNYLKALHFSAEAIDLSKDNDLTKNLLVDIQTYLPSCKLKFILRCEKRLTSAIFSPDGTRILITEDNIARLWDAKTGAALASPMKHNDIIMSASFSSDGKKILTLSHDSSASIYEEAGFIHLWDANNGIEITGGISNTDLFHSAVFSPNGEQILTTGTDSCARTWDVITGRQIGRVIKNPDDVESAIYSPEGKEVLTISSGKTVYIWNLLSGLLLGKALEHKEKITSAVFSPDGKQVLITSDRDSTANLWDAQSGNRIGPIIKYDEFLNNAVFSPDGKQILISSHKGAIHLVDAITGEAIGQVMQHEYKDYTGYYINSAVFSTDGKSILTASDDETARLWDAETGLQIGPSMKHEGNVISAYFSSDGRQIITGGLDGTVRLWDVDTSLGGNVVLKLQDEGNTAHLSDDGKQVLTVSRDSVNILNAITGRSTGISIKNNNGNLRDAFISHDSKMIVTTADDGSAEIWDAKSGIPSGVKIQAAGYATFISSISFSPDSKRILIAVSNIAGRHETYVKDCMARLWDVKSGKPVGAPLKHKDNILSAIFSPNGKRILTASADHTARLWDANTGEPNGQIMKHDGIVSGSVFSPDSKKILTVCMFDDSTSHVWDAATGKSINIVTMHRHNVYSAVFSPDSREILTASLDGTARLWNANTGERIGPPMIHQHAVKSAAFSPDGKWILTVSWDSAVHLWEAGTGKSIGRPLKHQRLIDDAEFTPKGDQILTIADYGKVSLWDVKGDLDLPANVFKLQAQVITGCELQNNELQVISTTLWYKLKMIITKGQKSIIKYANTENIIFGHVSTRKKQKQLLQISKTTNTIYYYKLHANLEYHPTSLPPKAVTLVAHGLNMKPAGMLAITQWFNEQGSDVYLVKLSGHHEDSIHIKDITSTLWEEEMLHAYTIAKEASIKSGVPLFFVGYSLGALLGQA